MKNFKEAFGSNLHNVRKSKDLTIEKFAEMLDVSPRQVTRIESGKNFPSAETLCKISTVLNIQLKNLFEIEWHDDLMYNASGKYVKPNIQVVAGTNKTLVKSLTPLTKKKITIKKTMPAEETLSFLINFSSENMTELIVEMFEKKHRDRIIKITPNGKLETIITQEELRDKINSDKNEDYEYISEKLKEFYNDKNKLSYIKASIDAISNKESLNRLKAIIRGIELTQ